jgi:hypothetical protein
MDKASQALAQETPHGVRNTYRGRAEHFKVPRSTLHDRKHGRPSMKKKAQDQQYLTSDLFGLEWHRSEVKSTPSTKKTV